MPVSFASENVGYWLWGCETEQSELGKMCGTERNGKLTQRLKTTFNETKSTCAFAVARRRKADGEGRMEKGERRKAKEIRLHSQCVCVREQAASGPSPFHYNLSMAT